MKHMNKFKENYFSMTRTSHLTRMFLFEKVFFFISSSIDVSKQQSPEKEREGGEKKELKTKRNPEDGDE